MRARFRVGRGRAIWQLLAISLVVAGCVLNQPAVEVAPPAPPRAIRSESAPLPPPATPLTRPAVSTTPAARPVDLQAAFAAAAREYGVPPGLLLAVSYNESGWDQHGGEPSTDGGYGMMHLTDVPAPTPTDAGVSVAALSTWAADESLHTLIAAAELLNVNPDELKRDSVLNVRGAAALLAEYARETVGTTPSDVGDWYGAVAKYGGEPSGAVQFADNVFKTMQTGATNRLANGQMVTLASSTVRPNPVTAAGLHLPNLSHAGADCPPELNCNFLPALYQLKDAQDLQNYGNYDLANRPSDGLDIRYIVLHDTESSFAVALQTFQDPRVDTSANYVIRSLDGRVIQLVSTQDVAHQAGNWYVNTHSIGIEHEGYAVHGATWYTERLYQSSATLVRYLAQKYHIPLDRAHIIGHDNVPGLTPDTQETMHWDPGPFWDWDHYMALLGAPVAPPDSGGPILTIHPTGADNLPPLTSCNGKSCVDLPPQRASFVYVHTGPSFDAPLVADSALVRLQIEPGVGTTRADDWGDKAASGEEFYRVATQGDWDAIDYGGQVVWFYNPGQANTLAGAGTLIRAKFGQLLVPVYGHAAPEPAAYPQNVVADPPVPLGYLPLGQIVVATSLVPSDLYNVLAYVTHASAIPLIKGHTRYYQFFYNHRLGFVNASDVDVVGQ
jgi:N-acetylmuramoyl-L-alanine amidase